MGGLDGRTTDFYRILSRHYDVEISESPDYVFCTVFGDDHLKYDCVRIFYTAECVTPDFNCYDYAIGFDHITFDDRYLRMPFYQLFYSRDRYFSLYNKNPDIAEKTEFCSFVVSNHSQAQSARTEFFRKLSEYKPILSGGNYLNNVGGPVKDKIEFISKCKFNIAFENCSYPGYTTEKIVDAFAAHTVPIYYGDPRIVEEFNPEAFINCHDYSSLDEVVERVKMLDNDEDAYNKMLHASPLYDHEKPLESEFEAFLLNIVEQDLSQAKRRTTDAIWVARHEKEMRALTGYNTLCDIGRATRMRLGRIRMAMRYGLNSLKKEQ